MHSTGVKISEKFLIKYASSIKSAIKKDKNTPKRVEYLIKLIWQYRAE